MSDGAVSHEVGIWGRTGDVYRRMPAHTPKWGLWADVHSFPAEEPGHRVVLLGESTARGFFYDADYTPALVLEETLRACADGPAAVIDLARTAARVEDLLAVAGQARGLSPDTVVLFAGNNWKYNLPPTPDADTWRLADRIEADGAVAMQAWLEHRLRVLCHDVVCELAAMFPESRLVVAVPDNNVHDWRWGDDLVPNFGCRDVHTRWRATRAAICGGLEREDWAAVAAATDVAATFDHGLVPLTHYARASLAHALDDSAGARVAARRARDCQLWHDTHAGPPGLADTGADALRATAEAVGATVVDLREIFGQHPTESFFLDYCHLTSAGIQTAMAHVAAAVLGRADQPEQVMRCRDSAPAASSAIEAAALFGAAIHSAHWSQPETVLRARCEAAVAADGEIATVMESFVTRHGGRAPSWATSSVLVEDRARRPLARYLLTFSSSPKLRDSALVDAITSVLGGSDAADKVHAAHAVPSGGVLDFLQPAFASGWRHPDWEWLQDPSRDMPRYFRAHGEVSRFDFFDHGTDHLRLRLTARCPSARGGACTVRLNGVDVASWESSSDWQTRTIELPSSATNVGMNRFDILWPPPVPSAAELVRAAASVGAGKRADLAVVHGHLWSLVIESSSDDRAAHAEAE